MNSGELSWKFLLEANLSELLDAQIFLLAHPELSEHADFTFYCELMIAYFRQDIKNLERLKNSSAENEILILLAKTRWRICAQPEPSILNETKKLVIQIQMTDQMRGENFYSLGMEAQTLREYSHAETLFLAASGWLEKGMVLKKSLRAQLSSLAAYSCAHPGSRLFAEYLRVYKKAVEISDFQSAAVGLINVSREFQILNVKTIALDYANQAIALCEAHHNGTREHGLGLAHRSHILFQLKRSVEAKRDAYLASVVSNTEVQSAVKILSEQFTFDVSTLESQEILPTWAERAKSGNNPDPLGRLESRLIELLSERPLDKFELIERLYDQRLDFVSREARLKNLLARVRKRFPDLLVFDGGQYKVTDPDGAGVILSARKSFA